MSTRSDPHPARGMRQHRTDALPKSRQVDVVVVGAGPAGLGVARELARRGLDIAVLEKLGDVGGRTRTISLGGERVNTGAMWLYTGTRSEEVSQELGLETVAVIPTTYGVHHHGRTVIARDDSDLVAGLALGEAASAELSALLANIRREYAAMAVGGGLSEESQRLAETTFTDHLGMLHPDVMAIVENAVVAGSTTRPEKLSAQYALRYFASYLVQSADHRRYLPDGMQTISDALAEALPAGTVHLSHDVRSVDVDPSEGTFTLKVRAPTNRQTWTTQQVVLAVPGPRVAELAPWVPDWKRSAIELVPSSSTVVLSVVVEQDDENAWDDVFFVACVGKQFNAIIQPRAAADLPASGRTYFNCYLSDDLYVALADDDEALTKRWLQDFYDVLPETRGHVLATALTRWPRCFSYPSPGRDRVIEDVRRPVGGLHFIGDYTSMTAGSHGALSEVERVVNEVWSGLLVDPRVSRDARPTNAS